VSVDVTEEIVVGLHDRRFELGLISLPVPEENLKIIPLALMKNCLSGVQRWARHRYIGSITGFGASPCSIASLSQSDGPAGDYRSFLQGYRCDATSCDWGLKTRRPSSVWWNQVLFTPFFRTRTQPANALLPNIPGLWTSGEQKPGAGDGGHGVSSQVDRVNRGISHHLNRLALTESTGWLVHSVKSEQKRRCTPR
jgi:hypothetical protein